MKHKTLLKATLGLLVALGLGIVAIRWLLFPFPLGDEERGFVGAESADSIACGLLPLPPQQDARFPMALDSQGLCDYSGFVVFRAPADWQERFRRRAGDSALPGSHDTLYYALRYAEKLDDRRLADFLRQHSWQPFHTGEVQRDGRAVPFYALRDATGEYLLIYYADH